MRPLDTVTGEVALPAVGGLTRFAIFTDSALVGLTYNFKALGPTNYPRSKDIEELMRKVISREAGHPTREIKDDVWKDIAQGEKYYASYDVKAMVLTIGVTADGG